jgi:ribosomal protein L1
MQKEGVDPSVKQRIVKRFDAVKTVAEAKTLYESVQMAFGALSEGAKKKKTSLSEALGIPNGNGRNISESVITPKEVSAATAAADPFSKERMRHLAGIK